MLVGDKKKTIHAPAPDKAYSETFLNDDVGINFPIQDGYFITYVTSWNSKQQLVVRQFLQNVEQGYEMNPLKNNCYSFLKKSSPPFVTNKQLDKQQKHPAAVHTVDCITTSHSFNWIGILFTVASGGLFLYLGKMLRDNQSFLHISQKQIKMLKDQLQVFMDMLM